MVDEEGLKANQLRNEDRFQVINPKSLEQRGPLQVWRLENSTTSPQKIIRAKNRVDGVVRIPGGTPVVRIK